ncbi:ABC transporter substrate-binding protein [Actinoplanes sp. NBRC 103695]|uniref:ABC transporter substrate-binding protein n=1 Tax=Actinoplanes sp. NBRC 103695 TaxID=3032202 RepID=UPI002555D072|nr:ABC transporter substrate-binding protein [Actinoplanes sp. NBRC 103695]
MRALAPLSVVFILLTGCGADTEPAAPAPASAGPVALTNCGTPVTIAKPPQRAVTMNQSATEIMLALGLQDRMIGTAYLDDQVLPDYAAAYAKVPVLAKEYPSKEKLLEAEPDFVYASFNSAFSDEGVGDRADWQNLGVGTYISPAGCPKDTRPEKLAIDDVFGEIREVAAVFGVPERAETLTTAQRDRIAKAAANVKAAKVLWWDGGSDAPSVGACCGGPAMIMTAAGVTNAFADLDGSWGDTSWETVTERNPDVIVLIDATWDPADKKRAFLEKHATLKDLPAVKAKKYVVIPFSSTSAGVRNVLAVEALAGALR